MQLGVAGLGLLTVVGTASLSIWLTFRSLEAEPPARRHRDQARLIPIAADNESWLGTYRLFSGDGMEFLPGGVYRGANSDGWNSESDSWCWLGEVDHSSRWTRDGTTVRVAPYERVGPREYELGLLDGEYVLLTEFCTWRRAP